MRKMKFFAVFIGIAVLLSACSVPRRVPRTFDPSNPLKTIAALPMRNDSDDVDGPAAVRKRMIEALEDRAYVVKDVSVTDQTLRDQMGINLGGQLDLTTPQNLGEVLGVAGVLYGTLIDYDETNTGFVSVRKVRAKFKLVNTVTGQTVWERGLGIRSETRMAGTTGTFASVLTRSADERDKDVPWVTIESTEIRESNAGKALAFGVGAKLLTQIIGIHLDHETRELVHRVTETLPWGPGQ